MTDGTLFLNLLLLGGVWQPTADYNGFLAQITKEVENGHYNLLPHVTRPPRHIVWLEFQAIT
jgi:hypothetical protein